GHKFDKFTTTDTITVHNIYHRHINTVGYKENNPIIQALKLLIDYRHGLARPFRH
ncbi:hypothetical protein E4U24_000373, partial [Claviceps purpurea]